MRLFLGLKKSHFRDLASYIGFNFIKHLTSLSSLLTTRLPITEMSIDTFFSPCTYSLSLSLSPLSCAVLEAFEIACLDLSNCAAEGYDIDSTHCTSSSTVAWNDQMQGTQLRMRANDARLIQVKQCSPAGMHGTWNVTHMHKLDSCKNAHHDDKERSTPQIPKKNFSSDLRFFKICTNFLPNQNCARKSVEWSMYDLTYALT